MVLQEGIIRIARKTAKQSFRVGDKVRLDVPAFLMGYEAHMGELGTVITQGGSMYADPNHRLIWVKWDNGNIEGVYPEHLIKAPLK